MAWNFVVYCVTASVPFCQQNPEIRQIVPQNYSLEERCVEAAVAAARKYKFDNPKADFKFSCSDHDPKQAYEPERVRPGYRHW
jgi:hypothetical protein